ncbi:cation-translocating P-type ATPase [Intrasporangium calvum]|uniref:Cation-translocating P-type ATPase n=1 Tax=Intrasporangium calvum TaxID=53358 RepID=A0ABT5GEG3_9MICO|nr:HAD-IC family P-type ATPase [Intrasporangium calvum]MDC5696266.1 cation-translocating P-type ATPase [Intrasporangium calvum]
MTTTGEALTDRVTGLTGDQVAERVARGQVNEVGERTSRSIGEIVRANVLTRFNAILGALFVLVLTTGSWADGLFGIILVVNSAIGITQEYLAKRKLDRLALLHAPTTRVVRDGQTLDVPTREVVLDDLIELRAGDEVPADGVLLTSEGLELGEANLTGESDPVHHPAGDEILSGTSVVAGSGRYRAKAVGRDAYVNRIAAEARKFTRTHSEIQASVNTLLRYITWIIVIALPLQVWSQWKVVGEQGWQAVVIRSAAGVVGLVPEGLVLLTSVAFLLAAVQLTRDQVLVQQLPAVEGLARVDVVCLDKTGTLTVGEIAFEDARPTGDADPEVVRCALGALADDPNANGTLAAVGAALDSPGWQRTATVPFNSQRKWSAACFVDHDTWVLGAPEVLLAEQDTLRDEVVELARRGRRVVLLARSTQPLTEPVLPDDLTPAALVTLTEQIRPDARATLDYFAQEGVAIKIISGDNPQTVAAVAREVGLEPGDPIDARTLTDDPDDLRDILRRTMVFGRVSPEQKRAFVHALQADGHVVAMTGDGVNDALALKDADIGVAMGNGAQATRAVAELVLLDGRFAHLPKVLAEGRRVIGNVERVANLFVAKNAMSLVAILAAALAALPFPFLPRHLTLVSMLTIGTPAFFLALGPNRQRYLPGFLRRILRFAVPSGTIAGLAVIASYVLSGRGHGVPPEEFSARCEIARPGAALDLACVQPSTGATITLLVVFFWILVVLARPFLWWKALLIGVMAVLALLAFVLPAGDAFFGFHAPWTLVWQSLAIGLVGAALIELLHRWAHRRDAGAARVTP